MSKAIKVFLATEVRIYKVGRVFYADAPFAKILERYSDNFGKIMLATRIIDESEARNGYVAINDFCCEFDNVGSLFNFLSRRISEEMLEHFKKADLVVMRLPSLVSLRFYRLIRRYSKKYMTEVMGCAWDGYWNHGIVGKIIAPFMFLRIRRMVKRANYCLYVTQLFLQRRYPCDGESVGVSNVDISSVQTPKKYNNFDRKKITIMTAAALDVKYKGQEYVIKAISELKERGVDAKYYVAGKGSSDRLEKIAERYGVTNSLVCLGMLPRDELAAKMREVDFYVQPSLQEGLPRSLIEAMGQGTVCLGSSVAGIPELLWDEVIFSPKDVKGLVAKILRISGHRENMVNCSEKNVQKAGEYVNKILEKRRNDFFQKIIKEIR